MTFTVSMVKGENIAHAITEITWILIFANALQYAKSKDLQHLNVTYS